MVTIRPGRPCDAVPREALLDLCFGLARFTKTCERLREGRLPWLELVATERGRVIGTLRLWYISAGQSRPALLLGPLAVDSGYRNRRIGSALMERAIAAARRHGHREILLVGDEPYYRRFGFSAARTGQLQLPGPFDPARLLSLALRPEAEIAAAGPVTATGTPLAGAEIANRRTARRLRRNALSRAA
jgi:predicted N-acetyltransferase YhbS